MPGSGRSRKSSSTAQRGAASRSKLSMRVGPFDNSVTFNGALQLVMQQCSQLLAPVGPSTSTVLQLTLELVPPAHWQFLVLSVRRSGSGGEGGSVIRSTSISAGTSQSRKREERQG